MKYAGACKENLEWTPEEPEQKLHTEKKLFSKHGTVNREVGHFMWLMHQGITNSSQIHFPPLQNPNEDFLAAEDALQKDLLQALPPFGGYENIATAIAKFSIYLFA